MYAEGEENSALTVGVAGIYNLYLPPLRLFGSSTELKSSIARFSGFLVFKGGKAGSRFLQTPHQTPKAEISVNIHVIPPGTHEAKLNPAS